MKMMTPISPTDITTADFKKSSIVHSRSGRIAPANMRPGSGGSASPLNEGERIEVRSFRQIRTVIVPKNPHPTLSLGKGEAIPVKVCIP
jgi:hypothetical protein